VPAPHLVSRPDDVTPQWLTDVLRHADAISNDTKVVGAHGKAIGTGQVGASVRYTLTYEGDNAGPATLVCKFASADPDSASAGINSATYETEAAFYRELASTVDVSRPVCFFADAVPGTADTVIVLADLAPAEQGDQIAGATVTQVELAIDEAAKLHGPRWNDAGLLQMPWMVRDRSEWVRTMMPTLFDAFVERYRDTLDPLTLEVGRRLIDGLEHLWAYRPVAFAPAHGDFRLDNLLFDATGTTNPITVVDWQTVRLGVGANDVGYLMGNSFADPAVRRAEEERLVARYHAGLMAYGISGYSLDRCWYEYRCAGYSSLIMAIVAGMTVGRTERGDRMFVAMADRSAHLAHDVDTAGALRGG
jgi:hypothetical protein